VISDASATTWAAPELQLARRNAFMYAAARTHHKSLIIIALFVEAGGVEPPSEKRCVAEPTCLSRFKSRLACANRWFASRA